LSCFLSLGVSKVMGQGGYIYDVREIETGESLGLQMPVGLAYSPQAAVFEVMDSAPNGAANPTVAEMTTDNDLAGKAGVLDNFSTGKRENLLGLGGLLEVQEGDLRNPGQVAEAVKGIDFVFHQAAFVSVPLSMLDPKACFDVNVQGTLNMLEAARDGGVQGVVIASSAAVYGEPEVLPLTESTRLRPLSPYAASKLVNEVYAGMFTRAYGLPVVALRYFNVYGPHQSPKSDYAAAIPIFIRRLLDGQAPEVFGDGLQRRDFIYVSDIARANLLAASATQAAGEVLNICTGQETTLLDLLETLAKIIP
jgi:UDP-glucose 4-epimerase